MPFEPGYRLGPYEILAPIGAGGMGEVWRARDTRLNREVAVKVLPAAFAGDPQYLARFEREAQTLAALHHPNIATVFGIEGGALVMELVEGPTLAERIARGALPVDEVIAIARQMIDGLEAAHERGIIHRDLKPANVKLGSDGRVKLLDFGLAKSASEIAAPASAPGISPTMSPTLSLAMTQAGMILGTAGYMAPEQARGKPVDKRADIWAFGVVLYEMLTGRQLFGGETVTDTLASVVKDAPDLAALPADAPPDLRRLLERCLRKDPRTRLRDIGEARVLLDEPMDAAPVAPGAARPPSRLPWAAAGALALSLASLAFVHFREPKPAPPPAVRFEIAAPASGSVGRFLSISPNAQWIAWADSDNIYIRAIDGFEPRVLAAARVDGYFFWSPDSRHLGFQSEGKLRRIPVAGGPAVAIADSQGALGTAWTEDDKLIVGGIARGLLRVPVAGGTPEPVEMTGEKESTSGVYWPVLLPGGKKLLFLRSRSEKPPALQVADLRAGKLENPRELLPMRHGAQFFTDAAGRGHLLFIRGSSLMAQPFDPAAAALSGEPVMIADAVGSYLTRGYFAAAPGGLIAYRTGDSIGVRAEYVGRNGEGQVIPRTPGSALDLTVSPDGRSLLTTVNKPDGTSSIWVLDPQRGAHTRVTFDDVSASRPVWSPDGSKVVYLASSGGGLWVKNANGSGDARKIAEDGMAPSSWSRDGKHILVSVGRRSGNQPGLALLPVEGDPKLVPYISSAHPVSQAQFSPDNRWVAYVSDESGDPEVYLQPFPATGQKIRVSTAGGVQPRWRRDGRELFYVEPRGKLMSVALRSGTTIQPEAPEALFDIRLTSYGSGNISRYDVAADGNHFYVTRFPEAQGATPLRVILNWQGAN